jgi:hypothetical protein
MLHPRPRPCGQRQSARPACPRIESPTRSVELPFDRKQMQTSTAGPKSVRVVRIDRAEQPPFRAASRECSFYHSWSLQQMRPDLANERA